MIKVTRIDDGDPQGFKVVVSEDGSETRHHVTMAQGTLDRLAPGHEPEEVVEAAFRFLLDREPKEAILSRFDVTVISRYFPEFEQKLGNYLGD